MSGKCKIEINVETRDAIKAVGHMGYTYDVLLMDMVDKYDSYLEYNNIGKYTAADGE